MKDTDNYPRMHAFNALAESVNDKLDKILDASTIERLGNEFRNLERPRTLASIATEFYTATTVQVVLTDGSTVNRAQYTGILPNIYLQATGKDINVTSKNPLSMMEHLMGKFLNSHGFILTRDEKFKRQATILLNKENPVWTDNMQNRLRVLCADGLLHTWEEIAGILNISRIATESFAYTNKIKKPNSWMEIDDRDRRFRSLVEEGTWENLAEIAAKLDLTEEMVGIPAKFLSGYAKSNNILLNHLRGERISIIKRAKILSDTATLREMQLILVLRQQNLSYTQIARQIYSTNDSDIDKMSSKVATYIKRYLIKHTNEGKVLMSLNEFNDYVAEILKKSRDEN